MCITLDLILTSEEEMVENIQIQEHFGNSDHNCITWETIIRRGQEVTTGHTSRDWKRADWETMKAELQNINWEQKLEGRTASRRHVEWTQGYL